MGPLHLLVSLILALLAAFLFFPRTVLLGGGLLGYHLRRASNRQRELLLQRVAAEQAGSKARKDGGRKGSDEDDWEQIDRSMAGSAVNGAKADQDWRGVVGFFHPFCNAGGGGERVLWAAIRATQTRWPDAVCVVYTGDHDVDKATTLKRVQDRFNIHLHPPTVHFVYLTTRRLVLSSTWPRMTLLGQSLGSLMLAYDAFSLIVPDIFIDTMGFAFTLALCRVLFPAVPTAAYVHYPTISTDMLDSLSAGGQGANGGAGEGYRGFAKKNYWQLFAYLYCLVGSTIDVVMTNSTWTQSHIRSLWGPYRSRRKQTPETNIDVVFPPVAVEELESTINVSEASEKQRGPFLVYIAQFRPEKNHQLVLEAFADLLSASPGQYPSFASFPDQMPKLVLIGSVRDSDDATRVYNLRLLAHELQIKDHVDFVCDASWPLILDWLRKASIGVNAMWNEHFGIGVVEYQAAGLISIVNDSGGPKLDIVLPVDGQPTGFRASTRAQYAAAFRAALELSPAQTLAMRHRARRSARRFTDQTFSDKWLESMDRLVRLQAVRAIGVK